MCGGVIRLAEGPMHLFECRGRAGQRELVVGEPPLHQEILARFGQERPIYGLLQACCPGVLGHHESLATST